MAIIYSYPTVIPTANDLVLGTDVDQAGKPTKNFTIQSIVDIVAGGAAGLGAVLAISPDALQQSATNFVNLQGTGVSTFNSFTTIGGVNITGTTGVGFTAFTSTIITGTLQTGPQPNITSLGTLTALDVNGAISGNSVETTIQEFAFATDTNIASALNIKNYVLTNPSGAESLAATLLVGATTGATKIEIDNTAGGIDFIDNAKLRMGTGLDATIEHDGTDFKVTTILGKTTISNSSDDIDITASAAGKKVNISGVAGVDLKHNGFTKLQATGGGVEITGAVSSPTGSNTLPSYTFIGDTNTGVFLSAADTVGLSGGGVLGLTVDATDTSIEGNLTVLGAFSSLSAAQATFGGKVTVSTPTAGTDAATKAYVDSVVGGKTLEYAGDATGPFALNLATDDLEFNGDSNISVTAAAVNATKGIVTIDLNDNVTITGTMQAGTLSDGTFSGTAGTYTGGVSITSTDFVGALTGNASTATALATTGTINMTSAAGATLGPTASAVTYTSGGNISLVSVLPSSTVTSKLLTGVSFSTGTAVVATDTILEGVGKLQKQITDLPAGLDYVGTWDASGGGGGSPDLTVVATHVPGQYYICSADSNTAGTFPNGGAVGPSEWKIGDWCIRGDADNDVWQKIDNTSEVTTDGSGVAGTMPIWNNASELGSSQIQQSGVAGRTVTTIVDGGAGGDLTVEGNTLLGSASTDTINSVGVHQIDEQLNLKKGLGVWDGSNFDYGDTTNKVLVSGNGSANPPAWVNRSTFGYVESVSGGTGITVSGTAIAPIVNVDYLGTDNAILSATAYSGTVIPGTNQIWFNDINTGSVTNTLSYGLVNQLPFDQYSSWNLSDGTNTAIIASTNTAKILGGAGITSVVSPTDKSATLSIDYVGTDNAILSAGAGTPIATDELLFNNADVASGTVQRATIASIVDLGNETLAEVLVNGNTAGAKNIIFPDSTAVTNGRVTFGASTDLQIYHNTNNFIETANGTDLNLFAADDIIIKSGTDGAANGNIYITPNNGQNGIEVIAGGAVKLYYNSGSPKIETTSTGVYVTGTGVFTQDLWINTSQKLFFDNGGDCYISEDTTGRLKFVVDGSEFMRLGDGIPDTITFYKDSTFTGNVEIDGNLTVDGNIIHGNGGGIFSGDQLLTIPATSIGDKAFTLNRATTGTLIFDVWFTSETSTSTSVAKKYTVAHANNATPVYNKIIDTGPDGSNDFTVSFYNAGSGLSVECYIVADTTAQNIGYTVQVGHDSTNALTFTPAS